MYICILVTTISSQQRVFYTLDYIQIYLVAIFAQSFTNKTNLYAHKDRLLIVGFTTKYD